MIVRTLTKSQKVFLRWVLQKHEYYDVVYKQLETIIAKGVYDSSYQYGLNSLREKYLKEYNNDTDINS